jgi:predicted dehydrogenase
MADKVRMGYVGCGFMAQKVHIPNILGIEECELMALAEVRPRLGEKVRARFGVPKLYRSHLELAEDPSIEAVGVSAHFAAQGEIAADLLRAGKDVFMEKPMAVSVEQGEKILAAERQSGRRLMVGYMKRYDAGNVLFKHLLDGFRQSKDLGAIRYVRNHGFCGDWTAGLDTPFDRTDEPYPEPPSAWPPWMPERFRSMFVGYLQQYTHNVNMVRWLLDADGCTSVKAVDLDADGITGVAVLGVGGVRTVIESGSVTYHGWEESTQVYFEKGWMKTCAPPLLLRNVPATVEIYSGEQGRKTQSDVFPANGWTWSYKEELRHFVRCVRTGEPFRSPAADALEDIRVIESIYRHHIEACG